jgi:uncharacterized circularly permuted ATP-grasp superfamily protein/uncharacterized alpha-E superfamily protein
VSDAADLRADTFAALLPDYQAPEGHFDELRNAAGALRPQWARFAERALGTSAGALTRKQERVARQLHEHGVTYNVHAAGDGATRPWTLDTLPLILPAAEWEVLAAGLRQRARLLNATAADVYGDQVLLGEGVVPAALVFGHPGFLRAAHGVSIPNGVFVHQVAFDLARSPDGQWWVVGNRAQAPSGSGYALENRITVSRLFPDAFRDLRVHMLAPFFRALQETMLASAPSDGEAPHVVLLTPGPYSETYFEHAYLAGYLGFTLVEGGDLTVRGDRVYLKTLTGLRRVHAILRRLDDDFCDPLELRADSTLGVPGLVQAWRAGGVLVANAFGTSVLESPGLMGFLPGACERLLGEPLALPSVASWWCGEAAARDDVLPRFAEMVVKPAFPDAAFEPVFARDLDEAAREQWVERIRASPGQYVLQEYVALSHAPAWQDGRLESRALMLRVFLVADGRGDYRVLPGGLARIASDDRHVSGQRGGSSKDAWVLSDAPVEAFSMLPGRLRPEDVVRSQRVVSSRAGENLFWLGRYTERSESAARLLRAILSRLPMADALSPSLRRAFAQAAVEHGLVAGREEDEYVTQPDLLERDLIDGLAGPEHPGSLAFNLAQTARVAGQLRTRLSADHWRLVHRLTEIFPVGSPPSGLADALDRIDGAVVLLLAASGLETNHMTRDLGWRFLGLGHHLERLAHTSRVVASVAAAADTEPSALLEWLLDVCDGTITYRTRYLRAPELLPAMDLLLFDPRNPRSAAFQLAQLQKHLGRLPDRRLGEADAELAALASRCTTSKATAGGGLSGIALEAFLHDGQQVAGRLSDALALRYFSHVYESRRAVALR